MMMVIMKVMMTMMLLNLYSHDCDDVVEPVLSRPSSLNQGEGQHIHQNYRNKLKQIKNKMKNVYVEVSRNAYMKLDEIKKSNHPILDSSDVFCVQGD